MCWHYYDLLCRDALVCVPYVGASQNVWCNVHVYYIYYNSISVVYTTLNYVTFFLHLIAIRKEVDTDDDHIQ